MGGWIFLTRHSVLVLQECQGNVLSTVSSAAPSAETQQAPIAQPCTACVQPHEQGQVNIDFPQHACGRLSAPVPAIPLASAVVSTSLLQRALPLSFVTAFHRLLRPLRACLVISKDERDSSPSSHTLPAKLLLSLWYLVCPSIARLKAVCEAAWRKGVRCSITQASKQAATARGT